MAPAEREPDVCDDPVERLDDASGGTEDGSASAPRPDGKRSWIAAVDALARTAARGVMAVLCGRGAAAERRAAAARLLRARSYLDELERASGSSVIVSGYSSGATVDVLIQMAAMQRRSGRLWVRTDQDLLAFDLADGMIVRVLDENGGLEGERVGDLLVGMGVLLPTQLERALTVAHHLQTPLGVILIEDGFVTEEQLQEAVRQQSMLRLSRALFAEGAAYALTETDDRETGPDLHVAIDPLELAAASRLGGAHDGIGGMPDREPGR